MDSVFLSAATVAWTVVEGFPEGSAHGRPWKAPPGVKPRDLVVNALLVVAMALTVALDYPVWLTVAMIAMVTHVWLARAGREIRELRRRALRRRARAGIIETVFAVVSIGFMAWFFADRSRPGWTYAPAMLGVIAAAFVFSKLEADAEDEEPPEPVFTRVVPPTSRRR